MLKQVISFVCGGALLAQSAFAADLLVPTKDVGGNKLSVQDECKICRSAGLLSLMTAETAQSDLYKNVDAVLDLMKTKGIVSASETDEDMGRWRRAVISVSGLSDVVRAMDSLTKGLSTEIIEMNCSPSKQEQFAEKVKDMNLSLQIADAKAGGLAGIEGVQKILAKGSTSEVRRFQNRVEAEKDRIEIGDIGKSAQIIKDVIEEKTMQGLRQALRDLGRENTYLAAYPSVMARVGVMASEHRDVHAKVDAICAKVSDPKAIEATCQNASARKELVTQFRAASKAVAQTFCSIYERTDIRTIGGVCQQYQSWRADAASFRMK